MGDAEVLSNSEHLVQLFREEMGDSMRCTDVLVSSPQLLDLGGL